MGEIVSLATELGESRGYLATPSTPGPGVIVIQEWWGLVPHIQQVCDRYAAEGFFALAPDLYHGFVTDEPDEAGKLMMELRNADAVEELRGAVTYVAGMATGGSVGVTGFCMGSALTLTVAAQAQVRASVPFYGIPSHDPGYEKISAPVLGHYAEHDVWSEDDVQSLFGKLRANGVDATAHIYPGTNHAFFNDSRPQVYDATAASLAWARTLEFFREHLA